ncbi:MAG: carboxypeptidase-like regulatory domain-containing protein [Acidobacteriota bacterium]
MLRSLCLLLYCIPILSAQTAHVEGRVLNLAGQPLEGAKFTLTGAPGFDVTGAMKSSVPSVETDKEGNFTVEAPAGRYTAAVSKPVCVAAGAGDSEGGQKPFAAPAGAGGGDQRAGAGWRR